MQEGSYRKRCRSRLLFSSRKQLEKLKMLRRLQKANGSEISNTIRTLSYEDDGAEVGYFQSRDNSMQSIERVNIVSLDIVHESKEVRWQARTLESSTFLRCSELVSFTIHSLE